MDQTNGTQTGERLLPSVETLNPGLVLLFKSSTVDRRYVMQHINDIGKAPEFSAVRPCFTEIDLSAGPFDEVVKKVTKLRHEALESGRTQFILTPTFLPRLRALSDLADTVVRYQPGADCVVVFVTKIDGLVISRPTNENMSVITLRHRAPIRESQDETDGIAIAVSGKVHTGLSAVSAVIANALRDKWPNIPVHWIDPDGEDAKHAVRSRLNDGGYDSIDAVSFAITNSTSLKTNLRASKILESIRVLTTFAETMADIKNAINRSKLVIQLEPDDPNPAETIETLLKLFKKTVTGLELEPVGETESLKELIARIRSSVMKRNEEAWDRIENALAEIQNDSVDKSVPFTMTTGEVP